MQIDSKSHTSPNYNNRPIGTAIDALVIHTTEGLWPSDIDWLCADKSDVSAHFVISPAGAVYQLVKKADRAWHAGESFYAGRVDWNDFSIGIEISHKAGQTYPVPQINALNQLCAMLLVNYPIPRENVVKHAWIAVPAGRKTDPTDWTDAGFNKWVNTLYDGTLPIDPLKVRTIQGIDRGYYCGVGFYDTYTKNNGLWWLGYPITDETRSTDLAGRECTYMAFERATLKYNSQEGIRTALESESASLGWNS